MSAENRVTDREREHSLIAARFGHHRNALATSRARHPEADIHDEHVDEAIEDALERLADLAGSSEVILVSTHGDIGDTYAGLLEVLADARPKPRQAQFARSADGAIRRSIGEVGRPRAPWTARSCLTP